MKQLVTAKPLKLGEQIIWPPVVLAPMAGVTNQPFRTLCREFGPGLVYVNEMIMAAALVYKNPKTEAMIAFGPDESFRSLQLYGSDPTIMANAITQLGRRNAVDHIDLNFGCPAPKVTRRGGGAAVPLKKNLLREIVTTAVKTASAFGIPVTCKFRMGLNDDLMTFIHTGLICQDAGVAAIASRWPGEDLDPRGGSRSLDCAGFAPRLRGTTAGQQSVSGIRNFADVPGGACHRTDEPAGRPSQCRLEHLG